jgi:hypothetical protein
MAEEYNEMDEFERMEAEAEELSSQTNKNKSNVPFRDPSLPNVNMGKARSSQPQKGNPRTQPQPIQQPMKAVEEDKGPRYVAFHQPEVIGIYDNETGQVIAQEFKDSGSAQAMAKIMSDLDTMIVEGGFQ